MQAVGTWDLNSVIEKKELKAWAREQEKKDPSFKVHLGGLLTLCSIKHAESRNPADWLHKGRICFVGNQVFDQNGIKAAFDYISASPTGVHSSNINLFYGALRGHKTTQADAVRAYVQTTLKSRHPTYVRIPPALRPAHWKGKYEEPYCRLVKALYGHPESGGHWERHLLAALLKCGARPVRNHPSSFWFAEERVLLTVYVDDLLMSGPSGNHDKIWSRIMKEVKLDPPEPLDVFLGRRCNVQRSSPASAPSALKKARLGGA